MTTKRYRVEPRWERGDGTDPGYVYDLFDENGEWVESFDNETDAIATGEQIQNDDFES